MASTDIDFQPAEGKKRGQQGKMAGLKGFFWDSEKKQFMNRSGKSWAQIGLFYFVFYSFLAAFFAAMLAIFFQTLSDDAPLQTGMDSILKNNPGMGFRPMIKKDSTLIKFEQGKEESYEKHVNQIKAYLAKYQEEEDNNDLVDCSNNTKPEAGKACRVDFSDFGPCNEAKDFGYKEGTPCVLLKVNKVHGWEPENYDANEDDMPEEIGDDYQPEGIYATCEGENTGDIDNLRTVEFYPRYFYNKYFPYTSQKGYQAPIVFARLKNLEGGVLTQIWCRGWAKNMKHHKNDRAGSVHLEILMD